jgi:hypothetical protein
METSLLNEVFYKCHEHIWSYLTITDLLTVSTCSTFTANLIINDSTVECLLFDDRYTKAKCLMRMFSDFHQLRFPAVLTTGLLRRVLNRLNTCPLAVILIDEHTGRIHLDIGSAFKNNDTYLASNVSILLEEEDEDAQQVFKHLEIMSYDEYDDFNPRHPKPREKVHRRGDSYFNSDIELVVNELPAALDTVQLSLHVDSDQSELVKAKTTDLKSRLLARKKNSQSSPVLSAVEPLDFWATSTTAMNASFYEKCVTVHPYQTIGSGRGAPEQQD